tara:strand:+ start:121 stop:1308 length:1188 start_codon:yes stop_codon:yes gene_type:complete
VPQAILTLNAGSSSIKFALYELAGRELDCQFHGKIEGIGTAPHLIATDGDGHQVTEKHWDGDADLTHEDFLGDLLDWVEDHLGGDLLIGVGHRVVHGGTIYTMPVTITPAVVEKLAALNPLAPLHQPHNIAAINAVAAVRPNLRQIACFDTAFHRHQPAVATRFALPHALQAEGIQRYGFHGISYEYIYRRLQQVDPALAAGRVIVAHLGNGASLCAMQNGRSIDTTMGFTALDGLMMGTRCGSIDPGVVLYLAEHKQMTPQEIEELLYKQSGLLGVSGISSDMRSLLDSSDPNAAEAVELFCYRIARETGALVASLGGIDGLIFTAGIGENAPEIRRLACARMGWLGLQMDAEANRQGAEIISTKGSPVTIRVMPTDEERMIALHTLEHLRQQE